MRHRRGIEFDRKAPIKDLSIDREVNWFTFEDLREWHLVGALCNACRRQATLDRYQLERRFGRNVMIVSLSHRLRCVECGNRKLNHFWISAIRR